MDAFGRRGVHTRMPFSRLQREDCAQEKNAPKLQAPPGYRVVPTRARHGFIIPCLLSLDGLSPLFTIGANHLLHRCQCCRPPKAGSRYAASSLESFHFNAASARARARVCPSFWRIQLRGPPLIHPSIHHQFPFSCL